MLIKNGVAKGCGVYCIKTMQSKVLYIGGTKDLGDAYSRHKSNLINGKYAETNKHKLQLAFNTEDLIFTVLENCIFEKQDEIETRYIEMYKDTLLNSDKKGKHRKSKSTPEETLRRRQANLGENNPHCIKLNADKVVVIKEMLEDGIKQTEIAEKFNVSQTLIGSIKNGTRWASV